LEVAASAVEKQFSPERAEKLMREDIADYYTESVAGLEPSISERPNFLEMRDILSGMRHEMLVEEGQKPTKEQLSDIHKQAKKLAALALQRRQ
jgi:DNA primase